MSKDFTVLLPNGRRQKVHCTPDTSILQILEDACQKHGIQPTGYNLKHHNKVLDLSNTIRFSNLPNKATLEMVETERVREESNVTIGLLLEDGERRTAEFPPNTSLYDLVTSLAPNELTSLQQPTILYMRQEVIGLNALQEKTLRQLGLIGGRAILRLLDKPEEVTQANVSSVYRRPEPVVSKEHTKTKVDAQPNKSSVEESIAGPSDFHAKTDHKSFDPLKLLKNEKEKQKQHEHSERININEHDNQLETKMEVDQTETITRSNLVSKSLTTQENLERRLKIEEEVTFLGAQKAIAFMQPEDNNDNELDDLPDEFYDLTIEEVRRLYHDLQQHRIELENTPLLTSTKREEMEKQTSIQKLNVYKHVVVRIQFPDRIILQGVFSPSDTIEDVNNFIKEHLQTPEKSFHIFTTPLRETLNPKITLTEAKFVPCVHMHFKWLEEEVGAPYLKHEIYLKQTSSDAASILASKYRAPNRRKNDETSDNVQKPDKGTTSKSSKLPKWFK